MLKDPSAVLSRSLPIAARAAVRLGPSIVPTDTYLKLRYYFHAWWVPLDRIGLCRAVHGRDVAPGVRKRMARSFVVAGDWDRDVEPVALHHTVEQLFIEGLHPTETRQYTRMLHAIESGDRPRKGCRTRQDVDDYFDALVAAYHSMAANGYQSQAALGHRPGDEAIIWIDRDGQLVHWTSGRHRLSIARVLEIPDVAVSIRGVHAAFADGCMAKQGGDLVASLEAELRNLGARPDDTQTTMRGRSHRLQGDHLRKRP